MNTKPGIAVLLSALSFAGVLVLSYFHFRKEQKLAYVDNMKMVQGYEGTKKVRAEFEQKTKTWQMNIDTLAKELEESVKKYGRESSAMSEKERKLTEELLNNKQQQFLQYREATQQKIQEEEKKFTEGLLAEINGFVKEYGEKNGYRILLGATVSGNIVYADKSLDITEEILKGLNERYNAGK